MKGRGPWKRWIAVGVVGGLVAIAGDVAAGLNDLDPLVSNAAKISAASVGFGGGLEQNDYFGSALARLGDLDGDGVGDIAVGASGDDDGGSGTGAVWVLFLRDDGSVKAKQKISSTRGGFTGELVRDRHFGSSLGSVDLDGDGRMELAVTNPGDKIDGQDRGSIWILFLNADGTVNSHQKIAAKHGGFTGEFGSLGFGRSIAGIGDVDGDDVPDLAVGQILHDGGERRGALWILFMNSDGTVHSEQKISATEGGFTAMLRDFDVFGHSVTRIGDLDGDDIAEIAVGAVGDDDGKPDAGAVWVLYLNDDGTVRAHQKISGLAGGLTESIGTGAVFGFAVGAAGDLNGDSIDDLLIGALRADSNRGAVLVVLLNTDGTVKDDRSVSSLAGGFDEELTRGHSFGSAAIEVGDLNGDGARDFAVGASGDDDGGGQSTGAVWVLFGSPVDDRGCTIEGDEFDNELVGTAGDDIICGRGGDDEIRGRGGNDVLYGGDGNDRIFGGNGDDTAFGDDGDDIIFGGDGDDELLGGDGDDRLFGHDDNDRLDGGRGDDRLAGGRGDDTLDGHAGRDRLLGDNGHDILRGGDSHDFLHGGDSDDDLDGGPGNDYLDGDGGAHDVIVGGDGKDILRDKNGGVAVATGGGGDDDISVTIPAGWVDVSGGNVFDGLAAGYGDDNVRLTIDTAVRLDITGDERDRPPHRREGRADSLTVVGVAPAAGSSAIKFELGDALFGQFDLPFGVAVDASGAIVVVERNHHRVQICAPETGLCTGFGQRGTGLGDFFTPEGVAIDADGNVIVADTENNRVQICDPATGACTELRDRFGRTVRFARPGGVAVDAAGNIVVADSENHRIRICNPRSGACTGFGREGRSLGQFRRPLGVAVDSTGNIIVADTANNRIQICVPSTGNCTSFHGVQLPTGVAVDHAGNIVTTDLNNFNERLQVCTPTGTCQPFGERGAELGQFSGPHGLAIDASGAVVVADTFNDRIQVCDVANRICTAFGSSTK